MQESSMEGSCVQQVLVAKPLDFFVQLVVPPKSTIGFVSNLNPF